MEHASAANRFSTDARKLELMLKLGEFKRWGKEQILLTINLIEKVFQAGVQISLSLHSLLVAFMEFFHNITFGLRKLFM